MTSKLFIVQLYIQFCFTTQVYITTHAKRCLAPELCKTIFLESYKQDTKFKPSNQQAIIEQCIYLSMSGGRPAAVTGSYPFLLIQLKSFPLFFHYSLVFKLTTSTSCNTHFSYLLFSISIVISCCRFAANDRKTF